MNSEETMTERERLVNSEVEWLNDMKCARCPYSSAAQVCVGWRTAILCRAAEKSPNEAYRVNMKDMQRRVESVQMVIEGYNCGIVELETVDEHSIFNAAYDVQTSDSVFNDLLNKLTDKGIVLTLEGFIETFKAVDNIQQRLKRSIS